MQRSSAEYLLRFAHKVLRIALKTKEGSALDAECDKKTPLCKGRNYFCAMMGMNKVVFLVILLWTFQGKAQIVNVESMRGATGDSVGTHGIVDGQFYLGGAQNVLMRLYGSANVRKTVGNETYFGIVSSSWATRIGGDQLLFERNGFLHGRYNLELSPLLTLEAFFQWQSDKPLRIDQRYNAGVGPRIRAFKAKKWEVYVSPLVMVEFDLEDVTGKHSSDVRLSTYVSSNTTIGKIRWNTVAYFQPSLTNLSDFRMVANTRLSSPITPRLNAVVSGFVNYDAFPAGVVGVPQFTFGTTTGLGYRF